MQEVIADQPEADQREYNLGRDRNGNEYLHFPQFCGQSLRIYRRARVPSPEVPPQEEEEVQGNILPLEKVKDFRKMIKKFRNVSSKMSRLFLRIICIAGIYWLLYDGCKANTF